MCQTMDEKWLKEVGPMAFALDAIISRGSYLKPERVPVTPIDKFFGSKDKANSGSEIKVPPESREPPNDIG